MNKNKFKIGQRVWINVPDSEVGVIQDIIYRFSTNMYEYSVCFGWNNYANCDEYELLEAKTFN